MAVIAFDVGAPEIILEHLGDGCSRFDIFIVDNCFGIIKHKSTVQGSGVTYNSYEENH